MMERNIDVHLAKVNREEKHTEIWHKTDCYSTQTLKHHNLQLLRGTFAQTISFNPHREEITMRITVICESLLINRVSNLKYDH